MAAIATDEKQDIGLRAQMYKELAQYVAPKRKAQNCTTLVSHSSPSFCAASEVGSARLANFAA
jgi:hypothetical protein